MEIKLFFSAVLLVFLPFLAYHAESVTIFDISKYGAKPGGEDISPVLAKVWKEACEATNASKVLIPKGTWYLSQIRLVGPNKAPLELEVQGTVEANPDYTKLPQKDGQWITINYLDGFTISGGGVFDGKGEQAWKANDCHKNPNCPKLPINLSLNFIKNAIIKDVTTKDSKNFHCNCISSQNVTFQRFTISAPGESINTDGIHIARVSNVKVLDSNIGTGDDCISIGDETTDLHIENVKCGPGHGISVGSMGKNPAEKDVTGITVKKCTFTGTSNGVRVKTWPNAPATLKISNLHFEDLTMNNVSYPVVIDQQYCPWNLCTKDKPSLIQISGLTVKNVRGTANTKEALLFSCSSSKPCQDVQISDIDLKYVNSIPANFTTVCENVKPTVSGKQIPPICPTPVQAS
ncbi:hypothetical protein ABFS83_13G001700 [Erythranthe nasuta]